MTILGICMDRRFDCLLIDEPELGLSPRVQEAFARLLGNREARERHFPHLRRVVVATHSHLFLSREDITSNFVVTKAGSQFSLNAVTNISEFHRLQFNLLGNSLDALFLPSAIVVVEGKTDHVFLERVLQLRFPDRRVTVAQGNGDVKRVVANLRQAFGDLQISPLRARVFVVLDAIHQPGLSADLEKMGIYRENIVTWTRNGIEYVYPTALVATAFGCGIEGVETLAIDADRVSIDGLVKTKAELASAVVSRLDSSTTLPVELEQRLLAPVDSAIQ